MSEPAPAEGSVRVGKRCFVGNLAWRTSWQDLKDKFRECGSVVYANVMRDEDGRSKGWGIVEFETVDEASAAIQTLNGVEMSGRRLLVREDREDRDIKQFAGEGGEGSAAPPPREPRAPRAPRAGRGEGRGGRGEGRGAGGRGGRGGRGGASGAPDRTGESSGLQVVVRGIPWSYSWRELKDLFAEVGEIDRADVMYGEDGRSRGYGTVRFYTAEAAQSAISKFNETDLEGRSLTVFMDKFA